VGRRAIRTGDLIVARNLTCQLWRQADDNLDSSDCVSQNCRMGLVIGLQQVTWYATKFNDHPKTKTMALVFDSDVPTYGWVDIKWIKRVE